MSDGRSKRIANLKPFSKGKSGNPNGRRKVAADVKEFCRAHSMEAIQTVLSIMRESDDERIVLAAAQTIIERAHGRVGQVSDEAGNTGLTIQIMPAPVSPEPPARVIEHSEYNGRHHAAEPMDAPTVSIRPVGLPS